MLIQKGSQGQTVIQWQRYLSKSGYPVGAIDGFFGKATEKYTKQWQTTVGLTPDGKVGSLSWKRSGLPVPKSDLPPRPSFSSPSQNIVKRLFGTFDYEVSPNRTINILGVWRSNNIVKIQIPQIIGIEGAPKDGYIYFHKKGVEQLKAAFQEIEDKGLKHLIISWAGSFYPRFIRGSTRSLSNHSWGTAFDINAPENWLGQKPAKVGRKGSLLELVPIFNKYGFYWGGHYRTRLDGMHFELAVLDMFPNEQIEQFNPDFNNDVDSTEPNSFTTSTVTGSQTVSSSEQSSSVDTAEPDKSDSVPSVADGSADFIKSLEGKAEQVGGWFQAGSRVSKSSWAVTLTNFISGASTMVYSFAQDNPIKFGVGVIVGALFIGYGVYYLTHSKNRDIEKQKG